MIDVGQRVRDYQIVAHLKPGGMATLFLARRIGPQGFARPVAIKVVHPHLAQDPDVIRMFLDEARLSACIQHPNVVHVEELGEAEGAYFLAMEYLHGDSLSSLLSALARLELALPVETAVWIAWAVAAGLHAAHEARGDDGVPLRIVHRDVSPQNVLVSIDGHVLVIDFGIARIRDGAGTEAGALKGKLAYMSPEQANGGPIDRRTDVYALGIVLWEMLTMKRLFGGQGDIEVLDAVRNPRVAPPSAMASHVPPALDAVVMRALAKDPDARFPTAGEMHAALLAAVPGAASAAPQLAREVTRHLGERIEARRRELVAGAASAPRMAAGDEPTAAAPSRAAATQRSGVAPDAHAIAVMPFRTMGPEASVGEGLADELRDVLSRVRGLRVKSHVAVREAEDASVFGERLGVGFVVTGRVNGDPARLRLALALTKVEDGFQVWSQKIERPLEGIWVALDDVATAIVRELGDASLRGTRAPADAATIELSLALRRVAKQAELSDPAEALALIARSDVVAPRDPVILACSATALARMTYWPSPPAGAFEQARVRAERAVDLGPDLPEPWSAAGQVRLAGGDSPGAVRALRRALAVGPSLAEPYDLLSRILTDADRLDESMRMSEQAIWLDPTSPFARRERVRVLGLREDWAACERELETLRGENAEQYAGVVVRASLWAGRDLGSRLELTTTPSVVEIARAAWRLLDTGKLLPEDEERFVRVLATLVQPRALRFYHQLRAEMCAFAGEHDRAIEAITAATRHGFEDLAWLERCSLLRPLRADPRLADATVQIRARAAAVQQAWDDW